MTETSSQTLRVCCPDGARSGVTTCPACLAAFGPRPWPTDLDENASQAEDLYDLLGGDHENVWGDVIYAHPAYDEAATSVVEHGEGNMVATTSGAVFRYDQASREWVRAGQVDDYR